MRVVVMQPYFFPYIGYFQLLRSTDVFVFYDDVQYVKGSWMNRNRILQSGAPAWFSLPVQHDSHTKRINERRFDRSNKSTSSLINKLHAAYRRAPRFDSTFAGVSELLHAPEEVVAAFNENAVVQTARSLGIDCSFMSSSDLQIDKEKGPEEKVLDICELLGATTYINAIGGLELYHGAAFAARGIELKFLKTRALEYEQFGDGFVPSLSIIDVMMFNSVAEISSLLDMFDLVDPIC